jgi:hypothetical protein
MPIRIDEDTVSEWRLSGCNWAQIQRKLNVSRSQLRTWRLSHEHRIKDLVVPSDIELIDFAHKICRDFPDGRGLRSLSGAFLANGWRVTECRVRWCLRVIDEHRSKEPSSRFRGPSFFRFEYYSEGPGYCWHADCNLKLGVVAGIVIFSIIDGYSRECIVLKAFPRKLARLLLEALVNSEGFAERAS